MFRMKSLAFESGKDLPIQHTGDGANLSPPLHWSGAPIGSSEFVLICEDMDSNPSNPRVHWLVYRIPANARELPENCPQQQQLDNPLGALQGLNTLGMEGYSGPIPPLASGWHHYRFRLFALNRELNGLRPGMTREEILALMEGSILAQTDLIARYERTRLSVSSSVA